MTLAPGDWVGLPDGRVAKVVDIGLDGPHEVVLIETTSGAIDERPRTFAERAWLPLPAEGLRVRFATAPDLVRRMAEEDPVGLVAGALLDAGGAATSDELRAALGVVMPDDELRPWWKRVQRRLEEDDRVDTSQALERRYRLLRPGQRQSERRRPRRTALERDGRVLLDTPTLLDARERMKSKEPIDEATRADLAAESDLANDPTIDPTDRFLAGEIAVVIGGRTEVQLAEMLGPDLWNVDLLRIKEHESRDLALRLAIGSSESSDLLLEAPHGLTIGPTIWSAIAAGPRWGEKAIAWLTATGRPVRMEIARGATWAIPGSPAAGDVNYPRDLETYRRRLAAVGPLLALHRDASNASAVLVILDGLRSLDAVPQHGSEWRRVTSSLCDLIWSICAEDAGAVRSTLVPSLPLSVDVWQVVAESVPPPLMPAIAIVLEDAYAARPALKPAFVGFVERRGLDPVKAMLGVARTVIHATTARAIVLDALLHSPNLSGATRESATLAGTISPDHRDVERRLESMKEVALGEIMTGVGELGPVLLGSAAWTSLVGAVRGEIESARRDASMAKDDAAQARTRVTELEQALDRRRETIQEVQRSRSSDQGTSAQRMSTALLKPVARALADSYESGSLVALQDLLAAVLAKARIEPIAEAGLVVPFDPDLHDWVGDGYPTPMVQVLTPGYMTSTEEMDVMVLAPARVTEAAGQSA